MQLKVITLTHKRPCDGCTACCEIVAAPQLRKPSYIRCVHACPSGCGIYETRPSDCRSWLCLWAAGLMGERYKPSESGLVFTSVPGAQGHVYLEIYEARPGALDNRQRLDYLLAQLRQKGIGWTRILEVPYGTKLGVGFHPDTEKYPGTEGYYAHTNPTQSLAPNHFRVIPTEPVAGPRSSSGEAKNAGGPANKPAHEGIQ